MKGMLCFFDYRDPLTVMLFCYVLYLQIVLLRLLFSLIVVVHNDLKIISMIPTLGCQIHIP